MNLNENISTGYDYNKLVDSASIFARICGIDISEEDRKNWEILLECMIRIDDLFDNEKEILNRQNMQSHLVEYFSQANGECPTFCDFESLKQLKFILKKKRKLVRMSRVLNRSLLLFERKRGTQDVKEMFILRWTEGLYCGEMCKIVLDDIQNADLSALLRCVAFCNALEHNMDMKKDWCNGETMIFPSIQNRIKYLIINIVSVRKLKKKWSIFRNFWSLMPR